MTQRNIDVMDIIVSNMKEGVTLSKAMKLVYTKRNVAIPFHAEIFDSSLDVLALSNRSENALMRAKARTIRDVLDMYVEDKFNKVRNFGRGSQTELFEAILDYCWSNMDNDERTSFLIDTVERNQRYIREEIA